MCYAVQERLTKEIADAILQAINPTGVGVVVEATLVFTILNMTLYLGSIGTRNTVIILSCSYLFALLQAHVYDNAWSEQASQLHHDQLNAGCVQR